MTPEEAEAVLRAAQRADGGCWHCFDNIVEDLEKRLPDVDWDTLYTKLVDEANASFEKVMP